MMSTEEAATRAAVVDMHRNTEGHIINVTHQGQVVVVTPQDERLDIETAEAFRVTLQGLVKSGARNLVIDLSAVTLIDSSGLGALVSPLKQLKTCKERRGLTRESPSRRPTARGDVRLAGVQRPVALLLEIIRLNRVFAVYPSVEAAVASY